MTNHDTTKKQKSKSPIVSEFLEEFGFHDNDKLLELLIENYLEAIEFVSIHRLDEDFVFYCENKKLYRQLLQSKFLKHPQHRHQEEN